MYILAHAVRFLSTGRLFLSNGRVRRSAAVIIVIIRHHGISASVPTESGISKRKESPPSATSYTRRICDLLC